MSNNINAKHEMNYAKSLLCLFISIFLFLSFAPAAKAQEASATQGYQLLYAGKILEPNGGALQIFSELLASGSEEEKARDGISRIATLAVSRTQRGDYAGGVKIILALKGIQDSRLEDDIQAAAAKVAASLNQQGASMQEQGRCVSAKRVYKQALHLNPGDKRLTSSLKQVEKATGSLAIFCDPWGEVSIDGKKTDHIAPIDGLNLLCGKYTVKVRQPGGREAETVVKVTVGERTRLVMNGDKIKVMED